MTEIQAAKLKELKSNFRGAILLPGDNAYESARKIWNAMIDKHPALILRCATTSDVVRAVNFARDNGLILAVRGGGHNIAGNAMCDDGIVIDLSQMKAANVDPDARQGRPSQPSFERSQLRHRRHTWHCRRCCAHHRERRGRAYCLWQSSLLGQRPTC